MARGRAVLSALCVAAAHVEPGKGLDFMEQHARHDVAGDAGVLAAQHDKRTRLDLSLIHRPPSPLPAHSPSPRPPTTHPHPHHHPNPAGVAQPSATANQALQAGRGAAVAAQQKASEVIEVRTVGAAAAATLDS